MSYGERSTKRDIARLAAGEIIAHAHRLHAAPLSTTTTRFVLEAIQSATNELCEENKRLQARIKKLEADIRHLAKRLAKYELAEIKSPTPTEGKSSCEKNG